MPRLLLYSADSSLRTPGQDYCGLSLVSPAPFIPTGAVAETAPGGATAYASLPVTEYLLLCASLSLGQYFLTPGHPSALTRALLSLLPQTLTASTSPSWGRGGSGELMSALSEVHRMFLLVDGRCVVRYPLDIDIS
jgi:hypothetical protein